MQSQKQKRILVCGKGEIGLALGQIAENAGFTVDYYDPPQDVFPPDRSDDLTFEGYDVIHVCFPIKTVNEIYPLMTYAEMDAVIIIDATIPLGIATEINRMFLDEGYAQLLLHSPVRGKHPDMIGGLKKYVKFVGPADPSRVIETAKFCHFYYGKLGIEWELLSSAENAAAGKLIDTTWYLTQIVFANQVAVFCAQHDLKFEDVYTAFQETADTGKKFVQVDGRAVCDEYVPRPVMIPGSIGGHCLLPNLELLKPHISPAFYSWVRQMHEYFASDVKTFVENKGTATAAHEGDRE